MKPLKMLDARKPETNVLDIRAYSATYIKQCLDEQYTKFLPFYDEVSDSDYVYGAGAMEALGCLYNKLKLPYPEGFPQEEK